MSDLHRVASARNRCKLLRTWTTRKSTTKLTCTSQFFIFPRGHTTFPLGANPSFTTGYITYGIWRLIVFY